MIENISEVFYKNFYATLLANMPTDTYNMVTQTNLLQVRDNGTHWVIVISGPSSSHPRSKPGASYDYAYDVNYNQKRGPKERANYMYVERLLRQTGTVFGLEVNF